MFRLARFPYAMPFVFGGMKVGVTMAMIGVIVGEFITAQAGLGYIIMFASSAGETATVLAAIVLLPSRNRVRASDSDRHLAIPPLVLEHSCSLSPI